MILDATPNLNGVPFELPFMLEGAWGFLAEHGVAERCRIESATSSSRFRPATVTSSRTSSTTSTTTRDAPSFGKLLDLQMLLIGGRERTEAEYRTLLQHSGYELTRILPTACPLHIIEAIAR